MPTFFLRDALYYSKFCIFVFVEKNFFNLQIVPSMRDPYNEPIYKPNFGLKVISKVHKLGYKGAKYINNFHGFPLKT